jgi:hypothetical protein
MKTRTLVLVSAIFLVMLTRLLPHPPNFGPAGAAALFAVTHFRSRAAGFLIPLTALLLSDAALEVTTRLGLYTSWMAGGYGFYPRMWVVYLAFALVALVGQMLRWRKTPPMVAGCTLTGSIIFFLVTNFVWWPGNELYPQTWHGLLLSYRAGLEFFRWTLLGDACFAVVLFGGFALAEKHYPVLRPASPVT